MKRLKKFFSKWQLEHIVLTIFITFGLAFALLVPPGHNGDEENHFRRVWQIASLTPTSGEQRNGAELPAALGELFRESQTSYRNVTTLKFGNEEYSKMASIRVDPEKTQFYEFPNTLAYSSVAYLPMYPAIWLGKLFDWPVLVSLLLARIFGLVATALLLAAAVRLTVRGKWIFAVAALLPMTVSQSAGINADGMTIATSFLFIAYTLRLALLKNPVSSKQIGLLFASMTALVLVKTSYAPLLLLTLLIPLLNESARTKSTLWKLAAIAVFAGIVGVAWAVSVKDVSLLYSTFPNQEGRLGELLSQPLHAVSVLLNTFFTTSPAYDMNEIHASFWGSFGWSNIDLPFIFILLSICAVVLATLHITKEDKKVDLTKKSRILLGAVYSVTVCAVTLSLYVIISAPDSSAVYLLQGRYFIPILPVLLLAIHGLVRIEKPKNIGKIIICLSIAALIGSVLAVYRRFYDDGYL